MKSTVSTPVWVLSSLLLVTTLTCGWLLWDRAQLSAELEQARAAAPSAAATADGESLDLTARPEPGTGPRSPEALPSGRYDASIAGSGQELTRDGDPAVQLPRRNAQDPLAVGALDAPVVISEFSDLECPFCARYHQQTLPVLLKDYVDAGYVRIEFNDLPVNGPAAHLGAQALRAAAAQGRFTEYLSAAYGRHTGQGHPNLSVDDHRALAQEVGVPDLEQFSRDLAEGTYDAAIEQSTHLAQQVGATGTPTFVVGRQRIVGAQPTEVFIRAIDEQLARIAAAQN